jgi:hypothetical protein
MFEQRFGGKAMNQSIKQLLDARNALADVYDSERSRTEELRQILEQELNRQVCFEEAQEIGSQLTSLYRSLAGGKLVIKEVEEEGG